MRVLIAGAGVSGRGVAHMMAALEHMSPTFVDNKVVKDCDLPVIAPEDVRFEDYDLVITSPGWRPDNPFLCAAQAAGLEVIGDVEFAWRLDQQGIFGPPRTWIGITGTNGKTTTTGMTAAIFQADGRRAEAVGNIGIALGDALTSQERIDILCVELSSFQLHWSSSIEPAAGVVLNVAEDHLDWHGSFANYAADKMKVLYGHEAIINADDPCLAAAVAADPAVASKECVSFTLGEPQPGQLGISEGWLHDRAFGADIALAPASSIPVPGNAGLADALAAAALARSQGVKPESIAAALASYHPARHRGQVVHEVGRVRFIDNSKATNPHAVMAALSGLDNIMWIAGGQLKGADIDELVATYGPHMKAVFVLGADRERILDSVMRQFPQLPVHVTDSTDPEGAMRELLLAMGPYIAEGGDLPVCLAPAAASLDMYSGMSERGDIFARLARELYPA